MYLLMRNIKLFFHKKTFFLFFNLNIKIYKNIGLVSAIQQRKSVIIIHTPPSLSGLPPLPPFHPSRSSQSARLGSLCCTATSHQLSILCTIVYICWCYSIPLSHSLYPPLYPQVHSLHLHLYSFPENRLIGTIFPDSIYIYVNILYLFFSFCLT